jgi:hypothetical protein
MAPKGTILFASVWDVGGRPGLRERCLRVSPERQRLARAGAPVIHAPVFGAVSLDQQVKPAAVG